MKKSNIYFPHIGLLLQFSKLIHGIYLEERKTKLNKIQLLKGIVVTFMLHKLDSYICPNLATYVLKSSNNMYVPILHPKGICMVKASLKLESISFMLLNIVLFQLLISSTSHKTRSSITECVSSSHKSRH